MIECTKCPLEYRGSIPKYCIECGTKLPDKNEKQQEKAEIGFCHQAAERDGYTTEVADNCHSRSLCCKDCPFDEALHICPSCRRAIYTLNISIPEQLGTVDLDVPKEDNPLVNMCEVPEPMISCPECKETIPQEVLDKWKVEVTEI